MHGCLKHQWCASSTRVKEGFVNWGGAWKLGHSSQEWLKIENTITFLPVVTPRCDARALQSRSPSCAAPHVRVLLIHSTFVEEAQRA